LVYTLCSIERKSFEDVGKWISDARNYRGDDIMIVLVGNKLDDEDNREVSTEEGINLAKEKS
jgi:GTPase SAR1 family protein